VCFSLGSIGVVFWYCVGVSKNCIVFSLFCLFRYISFSTLLMFLDKGCGVVNVQFYEGCRVFEMGKSYLCVSVPVLDDDCGAFVCFVYDDGIIDDKLFQGLSLFVY